jgi:hypothetical protein
MASVPQPVDRISGTEISVCVLVAVVSIVTSPLTVIFALALGLLVGIVGAVMGAASRTQRGRLRGTRVLLYGLATLAGPLLYLALAVFVKLIG